MVAHRAGRQLLRLASQQGVHERIASQHIITHQPVHECPRVLWSEHCQAERFGQKDLLDTSEMIVFVSVNFPSGR